MKRIFITDEHISSQKNGVGTYRQQLFTCLADSGNELNLLSFNSDENHFRIDRQNGMTTYHFPVIGNGAFLACGGLSLAILKLYVEDSPDNVFFVNHSPCLAFLQALRTYYPKSGIVFVIHDQGWTASLLGNREKLRNILNLKRIPSNNKESIRYVRKYCSEERRMYRKADVVVCLSPTTKALLETLYGVPAAKIRLIPNSLSLPVAETDRDVSRTTARRALGIRNEEKVLLFVGRPVRAKGLHALLKAFSALCRQRTGLRLVIAGNMSSPEHFMELGSECAPSIIYTGLISRERLELWYRAADIGVLPSYTEQCSFAGMEMMSHRLLIVSTDGNGLTDMFRHQENAIIANIGNREDETDFVENLKRALSAALDMPENEREALCARAYETVSKLYAPQRMKAGYEKLLHDLSTIKEKSGKSR